MCGKLLLTWGLAAQFLLSCLYPKMVCFPLLSDFDSAGHDMNFFFYWWVVLEHKKLISSFWAAFPFVGNDLSIDGCSNP